MNKSNQTNIFGLTNIPSFLNDKPTNNQNEKPNNSESNKPKNVRISNDNSFSEISDILNDENKRDNLIEEEIELYKDFDVEYNKNSNFFENSKTEYINKNLKKNENINYNISNNSTIKTTEKLQFQNDEKVLNQNDNNYNNNEYIYKSFSIERNANNFFHCCWPNSKNSSFTNEILKIIKENSILTENIFSEKNEEEDILSQNKNNLKRPSNNNNYVNISPSNSSTDKHERISNNGDDNNSFHPLYSNSNINLNSFRSNTNKGILFNVGNNNNNIPFNLNNDNLFLDDNYTFIENNNNNISLDENENEIDLNRIIITEFNFSVFYKNYHNYYKENYNYIEPDFIKPEQYINNINLRDLWIGDDAIFDDESDLLNRTVIFNELKNFLENGKTSAIKKDRRFYSDNMSETIKTKLNEMVYVPFKKYFKKEIKIIYQTKKTINNCKSDYNYVLLEMPIYSLFSNNKENKHYIQEYINKCKSNGENKEKLLKYLCSKFEDCLDYFLLIKEDKEGMFDDENIVKYLKKEYKSLCYDNGKTSNKKIKRQKKIENKDILKDYLASLLLLAYNLKRLFYLKKGRGFKK